MFVVCQSIIDLDFLHVIFGIPVLRPLSQGQPVYSEMVQFRSRTRRRVSTGGNNSQVAYSFVCKPVFMFMGQIKNDEKGVQTVDLLLLQVFLVQNDLFVGVESRYDY